MVRRSNLQYFLLKDCWIGRGVSQIDPEGCHREKKTVCTYALAVHGSGLNEDACGLRHAVECARHSMRQEHDLTCTDLVHFGTAIRFDLPLQHVIELILSLMDVRTGLLAPRDFVDAKGEPSSGLLTSG